MGRRQPNKTKSVLKLPTGVNKGSVTKAYSTSQHVAIEGYSGSIQTIKQNEVPPNAILCRDPNGSGSKVWVTIK